MLQDSSRSRDELTAGLWWQAVLTQAVGLSCALAACLLVVLGHQRPGQQSQTQVAGDTPLVRRPLSLGDLEESAVLRRALDRASASLGGEQREVILMVTDLKNQQWAHNALLNLNRLKLHHSLVVASAPDVCASLHMRMLSSDVHAGGHCAHSSYLRNSSSAVIAAGLGRWGIKEGHPFHLWWQRWRYVGLAISMRFNVLNLDTDISLRADPYPLLTRMYGHRQLVVGIESEKPGSKNHFIFPAINVGFVYCRASAGGTVQRLVTELTRRVEQLLLAPTPTYDRRTGERLAINTMWEQEIFRDVVETFAFGLQPPSFRHALYHAGTSNGTLSPADLNERSREFDWLHEDLSFFDGAPSVRGVWLKLQDPVARGTQETLAGLPMWFFAPYTIPPYGNDGDGGWVRRPSPVVVAHMVFVRSKVFVARVLGFWDYAASRHTPTALVTEASRPRVFPGDVRVLALRNHGLRLRGNFKGVRFTWAEMLRFTLLALALQRRAVLPILPCAHARGPPIGVPSKLRGEVFVLPLGNASLCGRDGPGAMPSVAPIEESVQPSALMRTTADPPQPFDGCCMVVPWAQRWIDKIGLRPLRHERMLNERDLVRLLEEERVGGGDASPAATLSLTAMASSLRQHRLPRGNADAAVLYLDLEGTSSLEALMRGQGGANAWPGRRRARRLAAACHRRDAQYCQLIVRTLAQLSGKREKA